jgi:hypothetical protein
MKQNEKIHTWMIIIIGGPLFYETETPCES